MLAPPQQEVLAVTSIAETRVSGVDHLGWGRDGYVVLPGVLSPADLERLRGEVDRLVEAIFADWDRYSVGRYLPLEDDREGYEDVAALEPPTGPQALRMILPVVDISPAFRALAQREDVTAPARTLFGGD